ncbi:hypothetical protein BGZ83_001653 [Gryganskiella cystojenkinii]|nr:hypothetical protein BGZ83_001640 [Gryganskiella cystojenkinii]KAG0053121.1 hypothetical protein BGZ83_001653 [Gryganskiella cystojenkinii]
MFERLWSRLLFVSITGLQGYPNLQPLNYLDVHIDTKDWPASKGPNRIQELVMTQHSIFSSEVHLWILRQCPDLRRLTWQVHYQFDTPMQRLAEVMESGQACRRLEELSLSKIHGFRNQQLGRILDLIEPGRLFKIDLSSTRFNRRSWEIFRNVHESAHCLSIRELSLDGCRQLLGKAVQEMLCSMPQLEIFRAESLRDTDIHEDPLPWVCLGLKELQLGFKIESTPPTRSNFFPFLPRWISVQEQRHRHEQEQQRRSLIFWSQLKRLTKLEILTRFVPQDEQSGSLVRLSLKEGGLAELKSLRQLRVVDENVTRSGEEEVEWMLENWPRLEKHCKRELDDRLKELSLNE